MANQVFIYERRAGKSVKGLVDAVNAYLSGTENMQTQILVDESGKQVLQARANNGRFKQLVGMDKAITVRFGEKNPSSISMEIGEAKWADKGAIMTLSMFVIWPLFITSSIGMYKQGKLPGRIKNVAEEYLGTTPPEPFDDKPGKFSEFANSTAVQKIVLNSQKFIPKITDIIGRTLRF